jgi:hypothetical protein
VAEVTSIVRDRRRAFGVVAALAASVALVSAPAAFGADDPIASGSFNLTLSSSFKNQLKRNHVKMKPKAIRIGDASGLNPITGSGTIRLGKIKFTKGDKTTAYKNVKARLPAVGQGAKSKGGIRGGDGKLFALNSSAATVTRDGFGATVSGIRVKFWRGAVKKLNKQLELHSLKKGPAGTLSISEQPETVEVQGGNAYVTVALPLRVDPTFGGHAVSDKLQYHCISPSEGVNAIPPAIRPIDPTVGGTTANFVFPATSGTISPAGTDGVVQLAGGIFIQNGHAGLTSEFLFPQPPDCPPFLRGDDSTSWLKQTNLAPNLGLHNLQANAELGGTNPGCWSLPGAPKNPPDCGVLPGDKGVAIAQNIDASNVTVTADPDNHTIIYAGAVITDNALSSLVLGQGLTPGGQAAGLFPNAKCTESPPHSPPGICEPVFPGFPSGRKLADCDPGATCRPDPAFDFADGDVFGVMTITAQVR